MRGEVGSEVRTIPLCVSSVSFLSLLGFCLCLPAQIGSASTVSNALALSSGTFAVGAGAGGSAQAGWIGHIDEVSRHTGHSTNVQSAQAHSMSPLHLHSPARCSLALVCPCALFCQFYLFNVFLTTDQIKRHYYADFTTTPTANIQLWLSMDEETGSPATVDSGGGLGLTLGASGYSFSGSSAGLDAHCITKKDSNWACSAGTSNDGWASLTAVNTGFTSSLPYDFNSNSFTVELSVCATPPSKHNRRSQYCVRGCSVHLRQWRRHEALSAWGHRALTLVLAVGAHGAPYVATLYSLACVRVDIPLCACACCALCSWARRTIATASGSDVETMFAVGSAYSNSNQLWMGVRNNHPAEGFWGDDCEVSVTGTGITTTSMTVDRLWHHYVFVVGGYQQFSATNHFRQIFVDGVVQLTQATSATQLALINPQIFKVGWSNPATPLKKWVGGLDELRLWTGRMQQADVTSRAAGTFGSLTGLTLMAWYRFNEGENNAYGQRPTTAMDSSGNNNHLTGAVGAIFKNSRHVGKCLPPQTTVASPCLAGTANDGYISVSDHRLTATQSTNIEWVSCFSFHICTLPVHTLMLAPAAAAAAMPTRRRAHADAAVPPSAAVSERAAKKAKHTHPPHYPARGDLAIHRSLCVCL